MKVYTIYTDSEGNYEAVKQGWSWAAFFFTCLWAVAQKIWRLSIVSLCIFFVLAVSAFMILAIPPEVATRLSLDLLFIYVGYLLLGFSLLMGLNGHQWQEKSLLRRGYHYQEMVIANSADKAIALYVKQGHDNYLLVA